MPHIAAVEYIYKGNGTHRLKKETKWNYQIQGEMAFSNKGILIVEVLFDKYLWEEMLVKLHKFYSKQMIPKILTQLTKNLLGWILYKINTSALKSCGHCWKFDPSVPVIVLTITCYVVCILYVIYKEIISF